MFYGLKVCHQPRLRLCTFAVASTHHASAPAGSVTVTAAFDGTAGGAGGSVRGGARSGALIRRAHNALRRGQQPAAFKALVDVFTAR